MSESTQEIIEPSSIIRREARELASPDAPTDIMQVIARAAADPAVDVAKMERLLALRDRELARIAEGEFSAAMQSCQSEIPRIFRDSVNSHNNARYARLETVNDRVIPVYTRHGFSLSFGTAESKQEGFVRLTCRVSHNGGHSRDYQADLPLDGAGAQGKANKTGVQAFGSTVSYGRRYLTLLIFNVTLTNEDTDGRPPGEAPEADDTKPTVHPRAERKPQLTERQKQLVSLHKLWSEEKAGDNKSIDAFCAWSEKLLDTGADLTRASNWTDEMILAVEEKCK